MRWSSIRASRLTGPSSSEVDRGAALADRRQVVYWCAAGHVSAPHFSADVEPPPTWECNTCGNPASPTSSAPPAPPAPATFHKTSYEFLMMRRTVEEGEQLLEDALAELRRRRDGSR